jgi:dipeptidase E
MKPDPLRRVLAIGGGGFSVEDYSLRQERLLLSLARRPQPRVLFLPTASGDRELYQLRFFRAYSQLDCHPGVLSFFPYDMHLDYAQAARDADVVFVGGGNTVAMLAVWREFGFDRALRAAYDGGTVLAGLSAGANAWFEHYVTDSVPGGGVRDGLGWLPGTFCPHLDSEPWRRPVLERQAGPVCGAGEGVAVLYENEAFDSVFGERAESALCLYRGSDDATLAPVPTQVLPPVTGGR